MILYNYVSLLKLSQSATRKPYFAVPGGLSALKSGRILEFYPARAVCRTRWIKDSESCRLCPSFDAEIQFLVIGTFIDDEGSWSDLMSSLPLH